MAAYLTPSPSGAYSGATMPPAPSPARSFVFLLPLLALAPFACAGRNAGPPPAPGTPTGPAATSTAGTPSEPPLPLGPEAGDLTLPHGLRYPRRHREEPRKRAALRLAVNAGSGLETDQEQALAHYGEHRAFNGTRLFKKQEMVDFVEKVGMRFG